MNSVKIYWKQKSGICINILQFLVFLFQNNKEIKKFYSHF